MTKDWSRAWAWRPAIAAALLAAACSNSHLRHDVSLVNGKESVYAFLSLGTPAVARDILHDEWNLGPRYVPVTMTSITWTEDPYQDKYWRFLFYSLRPTAHLLWAYYATGDVRYRDKLVSVLSSFADYDAAHAGVFDPLTFGYKHGAGFRALVLVNSFRKLERSGDLPPALGTSLRAALRRLGGFLADPANFESEHNHGFTEAAGLAAIAANFPELPEAAAWQDLALTRLDGLIHHVVDADGVEIENSPFYHFYVLGFGYQIDRWARAHGVPLSDAFAQVIDAMVGYATYVLQPDGGVPHLGASVDLEVDALDPDVYEAFAARAPGFAWAYSRGALGAPAGERAKRFPVSGQVMLRSGFGSGPGDEPAETFLTFNVGAWRSPHNHRDVLGVTLYSAGGVLLPDAGLFTYDLGPELDFFTGTRAHNTVSVDGGDQVTGGVVVQGLTAAGPSWAYQSGLHQLYAGVVHRRSVLVLRRDLVLVFDALDAVDVRDFAQTWHLAAPLTYRADALSVDALDGAGNVRLAIRQALAGGVSLAAVRGALDPMQGWESDRYAVKEPSWALEYREAAAAARFVTLLATGEFAALSPSVHASIAADGTVVASACAGAAQLEAQIVDPVGPGERVTVSVAPQGACP